MAFTTEQHREYQRKRRIERLALAVERLGGKCVKCGRTDDLQFDHIEPGSKTRKVSEATNWSLERFLAEVDKCQLLCKQCHDEKTTASGERILTRKSSFTEEDIRFIRESKLTNDELARYYLVTSATIWKIRSRMTWKHIP